MIDSKKNHESILLKRTCFNKYISLGLIFFLQMSFTFSQNTDFGITITDKEIELPNKYNYLLNIQLEMLSKKNSRNYYNDNNEGHYEEAFKNVKDVKVTWKKKAGDHNLYEVVIPPLKPNRFYRLKAFHLSSESIVAMFIMMHEEKNTDWYTNKKEWMKLLKSISKRNEPYSITYDPMIVELNSFKNRIKDIDLSVLDIREADFISGIQNVKIIEKKKQELKKKKEDLLALLHQISISAFEILNFVENQNKTDENSLVKFCKWIKSKSSFTNDDTAYFSSELVNSLDYINIYKFYENYLLGPLNDDHIKAGELKNVITESIEKEKESYGGSELIPNYLVNFKEIVISKTFPISTYSESFETSYKSSLVPDFGYVTYISEQENAPKGGNLFLGVNISLSPSNKNVPLQISKLSLMQRLSVHTGVTIGSIQKDHVRDDFFGNYSLLLGGSYKVLTQGTRINFGGLFYNKIDALNGSKSITVQPYIGLSIDLEIKKWLQTIFPKIKI